MDTVTITHQVRVLGGIARTSQLQRRGISRMQLSRAVRRGSLERLRPGVYAVAGVDPELRCAAEHGGQLGCASVLRKHGVWVLESPERVHVWLGADARAHTHDGCRCVSHRDRGRAAFGAVPLVQALIQCAVCLGEEGFFAAFESAWMQGLLTTADRVEVRAGLSARYRRLVDLARGDAESGLESLLRLRLGRLGLALESQVRIPTVGRVDFVLAGCIILEVDGRLAPHRRGARPPTGTLEA